LVPAQERRERPLWGSTGKTPRRRFGRLGFSQGKQIIVRGRKEWDGIYTAAQRKGVQALPFMIGVDEYAVVARGRIPGKWKFIEAGNVYYAREDELEALSRLAKRRGKSLDWQLIHKARRSKVFRVALEKETKE
jgi:hypothetical protein